MLDALQVGPASYLQRRGKAVMAAGCILEGLSMVGGRWGKRRHTDASYWRAGPSFLNDALILLYEQIIWTVLKVDRDYTLTSCCQRASH